MARKPKKEPALSHLSRDVQKRTCAIIVPAQIIGGTICLDPGDKETIKAITLSLSGSDLRDESHYDGYMTREPAVIKKAAITFEGDSLFINGRDMDCSLVDTAFTGMRVNLYGGSFSLLFDFYIEGYGYSKKCVILDFAGVPLWQVEKAKIEPPLRTVLFQTEKAASAKTSQMESPLDSQNQSPAIADKTQLRLF